ncbi:MAG TPA: hypothetical protein VFL97_02235 [Nitrococcus sp.]|nr:hypothetical protein [Nitrococcus sp.]
MLTELGRRDQRDVIPGRANGLGIYPLDKGSQEGKSARALAVLPYAGGDCGGGWPYQASNISTWDDDLAKSLAAKDFAKSPDFTPPIYNIWKQQDKSNAVSHFGNTEARWLENLLYLYTDPAALVASVQDWEKAHPAHLIKEAGNVAPFLQTIVDRAAQSGASLRTQKMADQVAKANPE